MRNNDLEQEARRRGCGHGRQGFLGWQSADAPQLNASVRGCSGDRGGICPSLYSARNVAQLGGHQRRAMRCDARKAGALGGAVARDSRALLASDDFVVHPYKMLRDHLVMIRDADSRAEKKSEYHDTRNIRSPIAVELSNQTLRSLLHPNLQRNHVKDVQRAANEAVRRKVWPGSCHVKHVGC